MNKNGKPLWLLVYYSISFLLFLFGLIATLIDRSGFALLATGPIIAFSIILFGIAYGVYYSNKRNKKLVMNIILWVLLLISIGWLLWAIIANVTWYNGQNFVLLLTNPIFIFFVIILILVLELLVILNKK